MYKPPITLGIFLVTLDIRITYIWSVWTETWCKNSLYVNHKNPLLGLMDCFYVSLSACRLLSIIVEQDATIYSLLYFCNLLYMFCVVPPPIIRSAYKCILQHLAPVRPFLLLSTIMEDLELQCQLLHNSGR